jgi:hypothetical protein
MKLQDLQKRNLSYQKKAGDLVDLIPGGGFLEISTALIRSVRLIDKHLIRSLQAPNEIQFGHIMGQIEEELDESVFMLDRIDKQNRNLKMKALDDLLKEGYDLLSIYSICCDQLIGKRMHKDEEML